MEKGKYEVTYFNTKEPTVGSELGVSKQRSHELLDIVKKYAEKPETGSFLNALALASPECKSANELVMMVIAMNFIKDQQQKKLDLLKQLLGSIGGASQKASNMQDILKGANTGDIAREFMKN